MKPAIEKAALQFGRELKSVAAIGDGLIHNTYKVSFFGDSSILLQKVNKNIFKHPENIISNYCFIYAHLQQKGLKIPALLQTFQGPLYWVDDEGNFWRAFEFIENSCSVLVPEDNRQIAAVAMCFGSFTKSLSGADHKSLHAILPDFHNLSFRYQQFEEAVASANLKRLKTANELNDALKERNVLIQLYNQVSKDETAFPTRIMHHDCKISNVLFDKTTGDFICPVDLDTVMPGKFFSDLGDMIRSMAATVDENNTSWEKIAINESAYKTIVETYLIQLQDLLTVEETRLIHYSGLFIIYMQALRFITDFLNNDVYYHTTYKDQNLYRANNQLILLKCLEEFIRKEYKQPIC